MNIRCICSSFISVPFRIDSSFLPLSCRHFTATPQCLNLFNRLHIRRDYAACSNVQHHNCGKRMRRGDANDWGETERAVRMTRPRQLVLVDRDVFGIDKYKVHTQLQNMRKAFGGKGTFLAGDYAGLTSIFRSTVQLLRIFECIGDMNLCVYPQYCLGVISLLPRCP